MSSKTRFKISIVPLLRIDFFQYEGALDEIILLTHSDYEDIDIRESSLRDVLQILISADENYSISHLIFLSSADKFHADILVSEIKNAFCGTISDIILLLPYLSPPIETFRNDGFVQSFILSKQIFKFQHFSIIDLSKYIFNILNFCFRSEILFKIEIIQVGKPFTLFNSISDRLLDSLRESTIQIVHKGSIHLLNRCLSYLNTNETIPGNIEIGFDDYSFKNFNIFSFKNISPHSKMYLNSPVNVGPFVARQHMVESTDSEFIFLSDSDDVSLSCRFIVLLSELKKRSLDILGSHELRIDEIERRLIIVRFPLDVNDAFFRKSFHPILHGTCLFTKASFLKAGGYSTDGKFSYDTQFFLRASFSLKMGNTDDFLYLRFRRYKSLTTSKKTGIGSDIRSFMLWRWRVDFDLVSSQKLSLSNSSLRKFDRSFSFKMLRITDPMN